MSACGKKEVKGVVGTEVADGGSGEPRAQRKVCDALAEDQKGPGIKGLGSFCW